MILLTSAPGFEPTLEKEALQHGLSVQNGGCGWRLARQSGAESVIDPTHFCFPYAIMPDAFEITGSSVNSIASGITDFFCSKVKDQRIEHPWPLCIWTANTETPSSRIRTMSEALGALIKKRMSRVARLSQPTDQLQPDMPQGLFICFTGPGTVQVSQMCFGAGQQRMKDDPLAPSRSFLKVEEAYRIMGSHPKQGERVADLGAAPGGWSYSAALRGAHVDAVDNGPLKAGAKDNPNIAHLPQDAFAFSPKQGHSYDWLFCDMVEDPYRILDLIRKWAKNRWCEKVIVNFKFGRTDPLRLLDTIRDEKKGLAGLCEELKARHLYHDREELTIMGAIRK